MSDQGETQLVAADLPIALYLNQRLTFDVLASLENGFSRFSTVQTTSSGEKSAEMSGEAQIGVSNVFAILGVQFGVGGRGSQQEGETRSESTTKDVIHTPASLFAKLRKDLRSHCLVRDISGAEGLKAIHPSDFVEFEATLRRSPLIEMLSALAELTPLMEQFKERPAQGTGARPPKQGKSGSSEMVKQVKAFLGMVTAAGSQDLLAEVDSMRLVLTTEQKYFIDPTMNDVIDGTFRVFGKVTRVISEDCDERISLLRKTAIGKFGDTVKGVGKELADAKSLNFGDSVEIEICGPTMQVIPLAIFS